MKCTSKQMIRGGFQQNNCSIIYSSPQKELVATFSPTDCYMIQFHIYILLSSQLYTDGELSNADLKNLSVTVMYSTTVEYCISIIFQC